MPENKHLRLLLILLYIALGGVGLFLTFHYLLVWLLPFLLALALAALLERPILFFIARLKLRRWSASALATALLALFLLGLLALGAWRLWYEVALLLRRLPSLLAALPAMGAQWETWVYRFLTAAPIPMQEYLSTLWADLLKVGNSLPAQLSGIMVGWVAAAISAIPNWILFLFTTLLATYFTSATRPVLLSFLRRQIPRAMRPKIYRGLQRMKGTFGNWLRAQGLLMLITFGELAVGFLLLRVDCFLLLAALVALVDALPVFGTGTVLLPWAAVALLGGNWQLGPGLLILYWVVSAVRGLLEPKLVGDRVGLPPLAALCAMYIGFRVWGVGGMVLAPLATMFLKELHDCGFLRLWRD